MKHKAVTLISKGKAAEAIDLKRFARWWLAIGCLCGVQNTNRLWLDFHSSISILSLLKIWRCHSFVKPPSPWHNSQDTYFARQARADAIWLVLGNPLWALEHALPAILCPAPSSGGSSLQLCSIVEQDSRRREEHNDRLDGFMLNMSKIDAVSLENNPLFNFQLVSQWFSVPTIMCRRSLTILIPDCQCKVIIIPLSLRTNLPTINSIDCHVCSWSRSNIFWWVLWRLKMHRNYRSRFEIQSL